MVAMINRRVWSDDANSNRWRQIPRSFGNLQNPNIICRTSFTRSRYSRDCVANDCSILQLNAQSLDRLIPFLTETNSKGITIGTTIYVYDLEQFCCLLFPNNDYFTTSNNDHPVLAKVISSYSDSQKYDTFSFG